MIKVPRFAVLHFVSPYVILYYFHCFLSIWMNSKNEN
jgi:hypothetical protein